MQCANLLPLPFFRPSLHVARVELVRATGLPIMVSSAFVQYELGGQLFTTETIEHDTHNPKLSYSFVHHVERVSAEVTTPTNCCLMFN